MLFTLYSLGQKKNTKWMSFQGALAGPIGVTDYHLAQYLGHCSQMLPHHLSQQVLSLFQCGLTEA